MTLLALFAALPMSALGLSELPPQVLPANSCALFLWDRASEKRVVMARAAPAAVTIIRGGKTLVLPLVGGEGAPVLGFAPHARYGDAALMVGLDMDITASEAGGGVIRDGAVTVTEADGSAVVAPVAGLIGCK